MILMFIIQKIVLIVLYQVKFLNVTNVYLAQIIINYIYLKTVMIVGIVLL